MPARDGAAGVSEARAALAEARAAAAPGSTTAQDAGRLLLLWERYLGPGTEGVPAGRKATVARALRDNAWWFSRWPSPPGAVLLRDPEGILLTYKRGQGFAVNPVATTGRWLGLNLDVSPTELASTLLEMGVPRRAGDRPFTVWEYYDHPDEPDAIRPGASGMAQARVALVLTHAFRATGERRFLDAARAALAALTVPVDMGGALSMVSAHPDQAPAPWYVERAYPSESPWRGAALNGFMVSLINLRGIAAGLEAAARTHPGSGAPRVAAMARALADRGVDTLVRQLPDHDSGSWSYYGLFTHGRPWRTYLADLNYHCYHVALLRQLDPLYPDAGLGAWADRWEGYVEAARLACPPR